MLSPERLVIVRLPSLVMASIRAVRNSSYLADLVPGSGNQDATATLPRHMSYPDPVLMLGFRFAHAERGC